MSNQPEPVVVRLLREHRASLLAREGLQTERMARSWVQIEHSVQDQMILLAQDIVDAKSKGTAVTEQLIAELDRYKSLDAQLQSEILNYAKTKAVQDISKEQVAYAKTGIDGASLAIKYSYLHLAPQFRTLQVSAVEDLVGLLGDGTPLYRLLKEAYPESLDGIVKAMLNGVARGLGPNQIATGMTKGMGMGLDRITLIARTEQLRMWRLSSQKQYESSGVVIEHKRLCAKDSRTCPACLFADGEIIPVGEVLHDHPRGRCTSVPVVKGAPETKWELGKEWFMRQDESMQKDILGKGMYDVWKEKGFPLQNLVGVAESKVWGDSPRVLTINEVLGLPRLKDIPKQNLNFTGGGGSDQQIDYNQRIMFESSKGPTKADHIDVWTNVVGPVNRSEEDEKLIIRYSNSSTGLNNKLRRDEKLTGTYKEINDLLVEESKKYSTETEAVVFRGIDTQLSSYANLSIGSVIEDKAWMTTTTAPGVAADYAKYVAGTYKQVDQGAMLMINLPKDHSIVPGSASLREIILKPSTKFKVVGIDSLEVRGKNLIVYILELDE